MSALPAESHDSAGFFEDVVAFGAALPVGNQAALARVAELCASPNWTPEGVALEVSRDERLAAELLRIANSAFSASTVEVTELRTAVVRLGPRMVRGLALAAPGARMLAVKGDGLEAVRHSIHRHAVRTGVVAWSIAPKEVDADTALTAGLLHNLGLNLLSYSAPGEMRTVLASIGEGETLIDAERRILGFDHTELGAALAERWSFPALLVEAIRSHAAPAPGDTLAGLVRLADLLVREVGIGVEPAEAVVEQDFIQAEVWVDPRERIRPLLEAQDRLDAAMEREAQATVERDAAEHQERKVQAGVALLNVLDGSSAT